MLGITTGAVRNRLSRGTLPSVKESGTVYVLLPSEASDMVRDANRRVADTPRDMSQPDSAILTSELRDRLRYVEGQLEAERQAHAEARRIIAGLVERLPPAIEAPQRPEQAPGGPESAQAREEAQEGTQAPQRPWWRRMFGG